MLGRRKSSLQPTRWRELGEARSAERPPWARRMRRAPATGEAHAPSGWPWMATQGLREAWIAQRNGGRDVGSRDGCLRRPYSGTAIFCVDFTSSITKYV
jgi:hypothetical protein